MINDDDEESEPNVPMIKIPKSELLNYGVTTKDYYSKLLMRAYGEIMDHIEANLNGLTAHLAPTESHIVHHSHYDSGRRGSVASTLAYGSNPNH